MKPLVFVSVVCAALHVVSTSIASADESSVQQPVIAIIIDDVGHHLERGQGFASLPYPITLSILPGRRHSKHLAEFAHQHGKEVMLHLPMENESGIKLGIGGLHSGMSEQEFKSSLTRSLSLLPYVKGINNHMGSRLTKLAKPMNWLMQSLEDTQLYFVDSRTSSHSVASLVARDHGIPRASRDVFLDHESGLPYIDKQFKKLLDLATKKGSAIGIGHPHATTLLFLDKNLPLTDEQGFRVATVSALIQERALQRPSPN